MRIRGSSQKDKRMKQAEVGSGDAPGLNVVFCVDKTYIKHFSAALASLLMNDSGYIREIFVVVNFPARRLSNVEKWISREYGRSLSVIPISDRFIKQHHVSGHVSSATYMRYFLADLLPEGIESALYLDSDLIVRKSLEELVPISTEQFDKVSDLLLPILAVRESPEANHLRAFGHSGGAYFNAGVFLANLEVWRKERVSTRLSQISLKHSGQLPFWDQDVLNLAFDREWGELDALYNFRASDFFNDAAKVVHFVGAEKPWYRGCAHPHVQDYDFYRSLSPFPVLIKTWRWGRLKFLAKKTFSRWNRRIRRSILRRT